MGGNSNFARPKPPTYRGCTVHYFSSQVDIFLHESSVFFFQYPHSFFDYQHISFLIEIAFQKTSVVAFHPSQSCF